MASPARCGDFVLKRQDSHSWLLISKLAENSTPPLGVHQEKAYHQHQSSSQAPD